MVSHDAHGVCASKVSFGIIMSWPFSMSYHVTVSLCLYFDIPCLMTSMFCLDVSLYLSMMCHGVVP